MKTANVCQDPLERTFSRYRYLGGSCTNPPPLTLLQIAGLELKRKFLADPEFDFLANKDKFELIPIPEEEFCIERDIPVTFKDLETEGLYWLSSFFAHTMRNVQSDLG